MEKYIVGEKRAHGLNPVIGKIDISNAIIQGYFSIDGPNELYTLRGISDTEGKHMQFFGLANNSMRPSIFYDMNLKEDHWKGYAQGFKGNTGLDVALHLRQVDDSDLTNLLEEGNLPALLKHAKPVTFSLEDHMPEDIYGGRKGIELTPEAERMLTLMEITAVAPIGGGTAHSNGKSGSGKYNGMPGAENMPGRSYRPSQRKVQY